MRYIISGFLILLISTACKGQGEANNWYFGKYAAISFNSGGPQPVFNSQMNAVEGCSSISDRNGNLLFYSDGLFIWNRNHQRMIDPATGFLSQIGDNADGTQTGVIIPWPGRDSLYFVFSIGQLGGNLYYSVVNMNRNGGLGEVVLAKVLLLAGVCEKLTAVRHCNKQDYWAVTHKFNSDQYCSFLISSSGITTTPVISPTGNFIVNTNNMEWAKAMGYLKNSPDGRLLAAAHFFSDYVELTDFNTTTGVVSNPKLLNAQVPGLVFPSFDGCYGIEFSPDSRMLYVSSNYGGPNNDTSTIYQFDVSLPTQTAIQASKTFITGSSWLRSYEALQLGPDKRIYVATYSRFLSVINNPNVNGTGCQFIPDVISIDDGTQTHHCDYGLPNFIQSFFNDPVIAAGNCQFSNISFSLQNLIGVTSVEWNFGDPASGPNNISTLFAPTHIFTQQGQYTIRAVLQNANGCGADTIYKIVHAGPFSVFLGNDTTICQGDTLTLHMKIPNAGNLWSNGSADTILKITQSGSYWVKVSLGECTAVDTINVTVRQLPSFTLGNDSLICSGQSIVLSPIPNPANVSYLWNTGATTSNISTISDGLYWLKVTESGFGCKYADSINVQFKTLQNYSLGADTALCEKDSLNINAYVAGASSYLWNTGAITPIIKIFQSGVYWADVLKDGCTFRDSITVVFKPLPIVNLGNDTTICESQTTLLDAGNTGSQYLWQNNSAGQTFLVTKSGNYFVKVTTNGCAASDTIIIKYDYKPIFTLGSDKVICDGQTITLQPTIQNNTGISFLWSNGSISPTLTITQTGTYDLQLTNYCGSKSDEVIVSKGVCKIYVPSGFTPNNDGKNDLFKAYFGENVTSYLMEVYNRWGQKIFRATDINTGWDGKINGNIQPHDSYVWVIRYKVFANPKEYLLKGIVTLIR